MKSGLLELNYILGDGIGREACSAIIIATTTTSIITITPRGERVIYFQSYIHMYRNPAGVRGLESVVAWAGKRVFRAPA